jgi:8-oxo-dGTP pyrophosphatase MutT (NUDIX family)
VSSRRETSAGGVVFRCTHDGPLFLLILDRHGNWGFPKGHLERGEQPADAARREVTEEVGLTRLELAAELGAIEWWFQAQGTRVHKRCHFFLFHAAEERVTPQEDEGIVECRWSGPDQAARTLTHRNAREVLARALPLAAERCVAGE